MCVKLGRVTDLAKKINEIITSLQIILTKHGINRSPYYKGILMNEIRECLTLQLLVREETWSNSSFFSSCVLCIEVKRREVAIQITEWGLNEKTQTWKRTYWFPNSEDINKNPVFKTHMADATGMVSKYFILISVTWQQKKSTGCIQFNLCFEWILNRSTK